VINDNDIVYLQISTWRGISIGAVHYYGKLAGRVDGTYTESQLYRTLTRAQAALMNKQRREEFPGEHEPIKYKAGKLTKSFESETEIVELATERWQIHFPHATVLVRGMAACADPQIVLAGPADFKSQVNVLAQEFEQIGGYDNGNGRRAEELYKEYQQLLKNWGSDAVIQGAI
jgi:hypothetical protein